ncbi:hypothetical protein LSAT2_004082 [Lamellibrachia satsuma]|nr:hypothetical protein LSAT2_004082 [Lamellibrachia satsuma]
MQDTCSRTSDITFRLWKYTSLWSPTDGAATFTKELPAHLLYSARQRRNAPTLHRAEYKILTGDIEVSTNAAMYDMLIKTHLRDAFPNVEVLLHTHLTLVISN